MLLNKDGEQKSYRLSGHFRIVLIISTFLTFVSAESFSEFKKSQTDFFTKYVDEKDKVFNTYLNSNWESYTGELSKPLYSVPKPMEIPKARSQDIKKQGPVVHLKLKETKENLHPLVKTKTTIKDIEFDFFGTQLSYTIPSGLQEAKFYPQTKKGIANFFNIAVSTEYTTLIDEIKLTINELNLNDWGKYLLIKKISKNIFSNQDDSKLLRWFIFNKLSYALRVGLSKGHVVVMYKSEKVIYKTPIYMINESRFYLLSDYERGKETKVFTYKQDYPDANKALDLSLNSLPHLDEHSFSKTLTFKEYDKTYELKYTYNKNMIDFMATYPQVDYDTYFNAPLQDKTYKEIANGLRKYINGKKSSIAINFVLHFVQNAFTYEVDSQQFGREKVMFAEETLYYEKSDCEDRAILFAKLVKELFNVGVVGVRYKDHMATALYIPVKGDSVKVNSRRFVLADPTYINSSIGQSMNKYKSKKPKEFIFLKKKKG